MGAKDPDDSTTLSAWQQAVAAGIEWTGRPRGQTSAAAGMQSPHCGKSESIVSCLETSSQPLQGPSPTHLQGGSCAHCRWNRGGLGRGVRVAAADASVAGAAGVGQVVAQQPGRERTIRRSNVCGAKNVGLKQSGIAACWRRVVHVGTLKREKQLCSSPCRADLARYAPGLETRESNFTLANSR